jgi:hypothetical protein
MSNKVLLKFGFAFGLLAVLLIFLGVNFAPRISARPPANENIVNPAQTAGPVTNESQPAVVTTPASSASASSIESNPAAPASPASTVSPNQRPRRKFHYVEAR